MCPSSKTLKEMCVHVTLNVTRQQNAKNIVSTTELQQPVKLLFAQQQLSLKRIKLNHFFNQ